MWSMDIYFFLFCDLDFCEKKQFEKRPPPHPLLSFQLRSFMGGALRDVIKATELQQPVRTSIKLASEVCKIDSVTEENSSSSRASTFSSV